MRPKETIPIPTHERCLQIIKEVGLRHRVTVAEIIGTSKDSYITLPRQEAILHVKRATGLSSKKIGKIFRKDHSTILSALKRARAREVLYTEPLAMPNKVSHTVSFDY